MGVKAGNAAVEMVTLENGAVVKRLHGVGCSRNSVGDTIYGNHGRMESVWEDAENYGTHRFYQNLDSDKNGEDEVMRTYVPEPAVVIPESFLGWGDYKSAHNAVDDYTCLSFAVDYIMGEEQSDVIAVYEALDMWMCGFFGYLSCLDGGMPKEIPNLRNPTERKKFRNDCRCTNPKVAGDQFLLSYSHGFRVFQKLSMRNTKKHGSSHKADMTTGLQRFVQRVPDNF